MFIVLDKSNKIISIRNGKSILIGEIEVEQAEIGQILQEDGTFLTVEEPIGPYVETLEDKISDLQNQNLILMDALAIIYEEIMLKGGL